MPAIEIRDMRPADEYFVGTCSHCHESAEMDECGARRIGWLRKGRKQGVRAKVGLIDGLHAGFLYAMPIEGSPWGPKGRDLLVIPCLYVLKAYEGRGVGRALLDEAEAEARQQGLQGLVLQATDREGWWFMPAAYFREHGYEEIATRGLERLLWKPFVADPEPPQFLDAHYEFRHQAGKVVVDLFWNRFCQTSDIEAQRVREVTVEFGDRVALVEHDACDPSVLGECGISRAIYVQGAEISWGYEAPRDGIRDAIREALVAT